jgi:hypothetical protein
MVYLLSSSISLDFAFGIEQQVVPHIRGAGRIQDMIDLTVEPEAAMIGEEITDERGVRFFDRNRPLKSMRSRSIAHDSPAITGDTAEQLSNSLQ